MAVAECMAASQRAHPRVIGTLGNTVDTRSRQGLNVGMSGLLSGRFDASYARSNEVPGAPRAAISLSHAYHLLPDQPACAAELLRQFFERRALSIQLDHMPAFIL